MKKLICTLLCIGLLLSIAPASLGAEADEKESTKIESAEVDKDEDNDKDAEVDKDVDDDKDEDDDKDVDDDKDEDKDEDEDDDKDEDKDEDKDTDDDEEDEDDKPLTSEEAKKLIAELEASYKNGKLDLEDLIEELSDVEERIVNDEKLKKEINARSIILADEYIKALKKQLEAGEIDNEEYLDELYDVYDEINLPEENKKDITDEIKSSKKKLREENNKSCIGVMLDGKFVDFRNYDNVKPVIKNDSTMIPVRAVAEQFKAKVEWKGDTREVIIKKGDNEVVLKIESAKAMVNGKKKEILASPEIKNDRTLVPMRFIAESLGMNVSYDEETETAVLKSIVK